MVVRRLAPGTRRYAAEKALSPARVWGAPLRVTLVMAPLPLAALPLRLRTPSRVTAPSARVESARVGLPKEVTVRVRFTSGAASQVPSPV